MTAHQEDGEFITAFSGGGKEVKPENVIKVARIVEALNCTVAKTNGWNEVAVGEEFKLKIDRSVRGNRYKNQFWCQSSEHLVFFATLSKKKDTGNNKKKVILKFHLLTDGENISVVRVAHMTQLHCEDIVKNYNQAKSYLNDAQKDGLCQLISIVGVCIARTEIPGFLWGKTEGNNLWIEEFVPNFARLWMTPPRLQTGTSSAARQRIIACTDIENLKEFQEYIYRKSKGKHTICDLQGGWVSNKESFILCDIEFTDTLGKFGWEDGELLGEYLNEKQEGQQPKSVFGNCIIS